MLHAKHLINTESTALKLHRLRQRGSSPRLRDREVITMDVAGEFLRIGIGTGKGIWAYFRHHYLKEFSKLPRTDRTCFARQAASPTGCEYGNPDSRSTLLNQTLQLFAPIRKESADPKPRRPAMLTQLRPAIGVIRHLAQRFHCLRAWAGHW